MDATWGLWLTFYILLFQAAVWGLIFWRIARQAAQMVSQAHQSGAEIILGPEAANYQGWNRRFGYARTMGRLALTDRSIVFKRPIGTDIVVPLGEITGVSDTATLGKFRHRTGSYLALTLRDESEVLFLVRNQARWLSEMKARLEPVGPPHKAG